MLEVIEITRGAKPEGNCLLFGCTVDRDFYVKGRSTNYIWNNSSGFVAQVQRVMNRKGFVKNKDLKLNYLFR